jgi:CTP:molybdopterin cytidylyltransferase MocA
MGGTPKGLIEVAGTRLLEGQITAFAQAGGTEVAVVAGIHAEAYQQAFPELTLIRNAHDEWGPFYSLQLGLRQWPDAQWTFVIPVDVPCLAPTTWRSLAAAVSHTTRAIVPEFDGRGGHPVLLGPSVIVDILERSPQDPASRLDWLLRDIAAPAALRLPVTDSSVTRNLNCPAEH